MNGVKLFGNLRFCPPLSTSILLSILLRLVEEVRGADSTTYSDNRFQMTEEQRLLYYLLKNYERAVRPVRNASDPIVVKLGLTLTNIFDMDEKNQVLTTNVWLDQEWNDELLRWDPVQFNGIQSIRIPCDLIWLPDIVLYNNADDYAADYMRARAMVHFDGTIFWPPPTQLRSTCKIDVTYFPFDSQHCFLKFGSWTYHGFQVDVTNRSPNVDLTNYVVSGEFDLVNVQQRRRIVQYTCCPEPYPDVTFFIHVRRKTLYYMYNVVFPCMMMSALTLLVFCLPPDSGEKIALGITVLLAFSVFVLAIAEKMPETSDSMPLIGIYLTVVMGMTSVSVVMTVMVLNFHHRGPFHKQLPDWLRWLVLNKLRRLLCMKMPYETAAFVSSRQSSTARRMSLKITIDKLRDEVVRDVSRGGVVRDEPSVPIRRYGATDHSVGYDQQRAKGYCNTSMDVDQESTSSCACRQKSDLQREVVKTLLMLISRQELEEECETLANEWRQVAQIVDRLFFWLFLTATVTITVVLLIVIPLVRHAHELEGVKNSTRDETPSTLIAHVNSSTFNWTLFE